MQRYAAKIRQIISNMKPIFDNFREGKKAKEDLLFFVPKVHKAENGYYVRQLRRMLSWRRPNITNIALEGDYSSGKSSIVKQLSSRLIWRIIYRPKTVSFVSFHPDKLVKKDDDKLSATHGITELVQSEIVRQLYYGESPNRLKGSGYSRIGKSYRTISLVVVAILIIATMFFRSKCELSDFIGKITSAVERFYVGERDMVPGLIVLCVAWLIISFVVNRFFVLVTSGKLKKVSTNDLSIELSDNKPDFSQLVDLISFYFCRTRRKVIFFEDLDRLGDPMIFEALRQLNLIINSGKWVFSKVKFVYEIRGGVLCEGEERGNIAGVRAKMFDCVVPVIPFLSKDKMRMVLDAELSTSGLPNITSKNVISRILGDYTFDVRVLKHVINNFKVYQQKFQVVTDDDCNNCMSLSIIRVFCPEEFSKLTSCEGILDEVRRECVARKGREINGVREKYTESSIIKRRAPEIWGALSKAKMSGSLMNMGSCNEVIVDGQRVMPINDDTLVRIRQCRNSVTLAWKNVYNKCNYSANEIKQVFNNVIASDMASAAGMMASEIKIVEARDAFDFFSRSPKDRIDDSTNNLVGSGIIKDLIVGGLITEGYTRFVSVFPIGEEAERIASDFIFNSVKGRFYNSSYSLGKDAIKKILMNINEEELVSPGMRNFDIFDHLVGDSSNIGNDRLQRIIKAVRFDLADFLRFYSDYCL